MKGSQPHLVPKVHPATRPVEPEDPMTLHATPVRGDPEVMLRCLVEEYARMGWNGEQILGLFRDPFYPMLNGLLGIYGEAGIRDRIAAVLDQTGIFCCEGTARDEPEPTEMEPELIQLGIRTRPEAGLKGGCHAERL